MVGGGGGGGALRRVGKYEVGRTIGEGTFAKVKFAQNTETGESVAMKVLDRSSILKHKMAEQVTELALVFSPCPPPPIPNNVVGMARGSISFLTDSALGSFMLWILILVMPFLWTNFSLLSKLAGMVHVLG